MIKSIRSSKVTKGIACYLALMLLFEIVSPMAAYALTGGPSQPEFNSFTPIGTSDMVDLASGDFNYNIPIMDVGGYPINLAYNSGVTMDQEASWVGLGWDLNVGQINRQVRGLPDDFNGDPLTYENNMKPNVTVGASVGVFKAIFGANENTKNDAAGGNTAPPSGGNGGAGGEGGNNSGGQNGGSLPSSNLDFNFGYGIKLNNYDGFTFSLNGGLSYQISENLSLGMNLSSSATDGVTASPSASFHGKYSTTNYADNSYSLRAGTSYNNRKGIEGFNFSASRTAIVKAECKEEDDQRIYGGSIGTTLSYVHSSFTPTKRVRMYSKNFMFNLNIQGEFSGGEPGVKFSGYRTEQGIDSSEKRKTEKSYGYENQYNASNDDVTDFNREKDRGVTRYTTSLPITVSTFDIYSVQGQGIAGSFRPYSGQVGYLFDNYANDNSTGGSLGLELGFPALVKFGFDFSVTKGDSRSGLWSANNVALAKFEEKRTGNRLDYEKTYFKNIGGFHVDRELALFSEKLGGYNPVKLQMGGTRFNRGTNPVYEKKAGSLNSYSSINITAPLKRQSRISRGQTIQKLTRAEAEKFGFATQFSPWSSGKKHRHHTSEIRVIKDGGERYVYGRALYNIVKKEATFNIGDKKGDCQTGLVPYAPNADNSPGNKQGKDHYFNRVTTPPYAHTFLLTSVLSSDYSDLTNNGPTDDDLGTYTKFVYNDRNTKKNTYKWRVPFDKNMANFDDGIKSINSDNKGNYLYGEKEMVYIDTIVTKTHIAIFHLSPRQDGYGVDGENGGASATTSSRMYKLDKISLYSKPEFESLGENATPIKEAHFVYDYSLCGKIKNNFRSTLTQNEKDNQGGKLTLLKLYFTYGKSKMGQYTPYRFNYPAGSNYDYDMKAYDAWGNYKPTAQNVGCGTFDALPNTEYPFVEQNKQSADNYSRAWLLQSVTLPSGGKIDLTYESDDYQYVQNREVMQMFKVAGVGDGVSSAFSDKLNGNGLAPGSHLYVEIPQEIVPAGTNEQLIVNSLKSKLIRSLGSKPVYFNFLLNMGAQDTHPDRYDYVSGYLNLGSGEFKHFTVGNKHYFAIPVAKVPKKDGIGNDDISPITKAGWQFGRQYLNRYVYTNADDEVTDDLKEVVMEIINSLPALATMFQSPNKPLEQKKIAFKFVPGKSWIRLMCPNRIKYGGGSRVKEIRMSDQWNVMTGHDNDSDYKQEYGQQYTYKKSDNTSSGVATYEPLGNKENPFVEPFDINEGVPSKYLGTDEQNYVEMPMGESFFPSPKITYSEVKVQNLPRSKTIGGEEKVVRKHATGYVVTQHFTTFDYPTLTDYTDMSVEYDKSSMLASILNLSVKDHLTMTQGYVIHTNDMDGKLRSQRVFAEGSNTAISGADYYYEDVAANSSRISGKLDNTVTAISPDGQVASKLVGVDYDVFNDFRHNVNESQTIGVNFNAATIPFLVPPTIVIPLPKYSKHDSQLRTAVTTKVIHSSGILRETRVFDVGSSSVSTRNLAWDANTGEILLTETINEYNDKYYSFNYPAYWSYAGMKQSAFNIGLQGQLKRSGTSNRYRLNPVVNPGEYLTDGDELWVKPTKVVATPDNEFDEIQEFRAYVVNITGNEFTLIDEDGIEVSPEKLDEGDFIIARSGYRNMATASMASVTSMQNPLQSVVNGKLPANLFSAASPLTYRIVNATAILYNDEWAPPCECRLPKVKKDAHGKIIYNYKGDRLSKKVAYNPYRYNVKGNWRPKVSYAYLTGRNATENPHPRNDGFFKTFDPFYVLGTNQWVRATGQDTLKWKRASEITQYNPFGAEIENKDALNRRSSAIYGYNYRFPVAVAANARYSDIAFDGFEDYDLSTCGEKAHFGFQGSLNKQEITISSKQAHSGTKSLRVTPHKTAVIKKRVVTCGSTTPQQP